MAPRIILASMPIPFRFLRFRRETLPQLAIKSPTDGPGVPHGKPGPQPLQTAHKPDSVLDDHSSRRRVTAALQQPTRRFRLFGSRQSLSAWAHRADTLVPAGECGRDPCLFGLAPCGVYHAASLTRCPVRSYRTFSPLPHLLRDAAVYFLLHWPSLYLEVQIPDVIRHTALRSPDFPPPPDGLVSLEARCGRQRSSGRLHG